MMITAIVRFKLTPGEDHATAIAEIRATVPLYQNAGPALIRKQISIDAAKGEGTSVYLWQDRGSAEAFFTMAKAHIKARTGQEPDVELLDLHVLVDNEKGDVFYAD